MMLIKLSDHPILMLSLSFSTMEICKQEDCVIMACPEEIEDPNGVLVHNATDDSHIHKCKPGFYFGPEAPKEKKQTQIPVTCKFNPLLGKKQWVPKGSDSEEITEQRFLFVCFLPVLPMKMMTFPSDIVPRDVKTPRTALRTKSA